MKIKSILCVVLSLLICAVFCGCDLFAADAELLITPPELTGDMYPIGEAIKQSAGGDYVLKHPTMGDRRSAVIMEDINSDGALEAFAFYSTSEDELINMHINLISAESGEWKSVAEQAIVASGVEMVDFADIDTDGTKEIIVGWEIYGSLEKQLSVFSYVDGVFSQRLNQKYTSFLCCDLDQNDENEIFIQYLDAQNATNTAMLFNLVEEGAQKTAGCMLDGAVKSVQSVTLGTLSTGQKALFIDEIKGVGAITEVLYLSKGELVNPLLEGEAIFENSKTLRAAALYSKDINEDGIIEIPVSSPLPNADGTSEALYYTNWCSFNGDTLTQKLVTIVNTVDRYYIEVPAAFVGKIAVGKNLDKHSRTIYSYNPEENTVGERLATISVVTEKSFDDKKMLKLGARGEDIFAAELNRVEGGNNITEKAIEDAFKLIEE